MLDYVTLCLLCYVILCYTFLTILFVLSYDNDMGYKQETGTSVPCFDYHAAVVILLPKRSVSVSRQNTVISGSRIGVRARIWSWYSLCWLNSDMFTEAHNVPGPELAFIPYTNIYETHLPHQSASVCHFIEVCVLKCAGICPLCSYASCDFCRSPYAYIFS